MKSEFRFLHYFYNKKYKLYISLQSSSIPQRNFSCLQMAKLDDFNEKHLFFIIENPPPFFTPFMHYFYKQTTACQLDYPNQTPDLFLYVARRVTVTLRCIQCFFDNAAW